MLHRLDLKRALRDPAMTLRSNLIANVAGKAWSGAMGFAFVPFYIRFLGIEAYGLIGFFVSLLALFFVLDMGLSVAITRELAKRTSDHDKTEVRDMVRTLEVIYWSIGIVLGGGVVMAAPLLASGWLHPQTLSLETTTAAVRMIGLVIMLRWPVTLYSGALAGLERQVQLNLLTASYATIQGGGAVLVLWLVSPTITAFFSWQLIAAAAQITLMVVAVWRSLPITSSSPAFRPAALASMASFSAGIFGITILSVILNQLDKFMLSRLLPLSVFGTYSLAGTVAASLNLAAMAIYAAVFPRLSRLVAGELSGELVRTYHKCAQLTSALVIPAGLTLALFARELLTLYVHDPAIVDPAAPLLRLLVIGNIFLSLMLLPLALQLAYGWVKLSLYKNIVAVAIFVPLLWIMVSRYGPIGAASVWIVLTAGYFLIEVPIMHARLLRTEKWRWYLLDVGLPAGIALVVLGGLRLMLPVTAPLAVSVPLIAAAAAVTFGASLAAMPSTRASLLAAINQFRGSRLA